MQVKVIYRLFPPTPSFKYKLWTRWELWDALSISRRVKWIENLAARGFFLKDELALV